jgi:hypothetical protein
MTASSEREMNFGRIAIAALGGSVAYIVVGFLMFAVMPTMKTEFAKYPAVFRPEEAMKSMLPLGMGAIVVEMVVLAVLYAMTSRGGPGLAAGAAFGALIGVFAVCSFGVHNYVNLNIGLALTIQQGVAYFTQWLATGIVMGLIYRPL